MSQITEVSKTEEMEKDGSSNNNTKALKQTPQSFVRTVNHPHRNYLDAQDVNLFIIVRRNAKKSTGNFHIN